MVTQKGLDLILQSGDLLETDAQFGVTRALVGNYVRHDGEPPWYTLEHTFVIEQGEARLPEPPITGKAT